ncbi:MAG: DUF2383 domain-containing protein [Acidobacteriaceae bacterium]|nr:DUF2383 domain-containing protein [Acidobacteriaceae bacterium]
MSVDTTLKDLLQTCADLQDGFWQAAAHAQRDDLQPILQQTAVQWNSFADTIFALLLQIDHTSPDAKWKANPNRAWMNHYEDIEAKNDRRICQECLHGLDIAQAELRKAAALSHPQVRQLVTEQLQISADQMAGLQPYVANGLRQSISRQRANSPGGDPSVH